MKDIPIIDISAWLNGSEAERNDVARAFGEACERWGFLLLEGHGLNPELMNSIRDVTRRFFDLPIDEKMAVAATGRPGGRGYYRVASKSHARTLGAKEAPGGSARDLFLRDGAHGGDAYTTAPAALRHFAANVWPTEPRDMGQIWAEYMRACNRVAAELLRISARALSLPDNWFNDKIDRPISTLTAQHYPKLEAPPEPGQVRSGAHTDFGTLTLLMTEDKPGGLQVQNLDGEWRDVRPVPGALIVNLGDMMSQWTNDRWRSTLHRVVNPPLEAGEAARRLSIVYFHTPNYDATIECIPSCASSDNPPHYAPILAGEHLAEKLRKTDSVSLK